MKSLSNKERFRLFSIEDPSFIENLLAIHWTQTKTSQQLFPYTSKNELLLENLLKLAPESSSTPIAASSQCHSFVPIPLLFYSNLLESSSTGIRLPSEHYYGCSSSPTQQQTLEDFSHASREMQNGRKMENKPESSLAKKAEESILNRLHLVLGLEFLQGSLSLIHI